MSDQSGSGVLLECPECGNSETTQFIPTFSIGGEFDVTVTEIDCSTCGYEGPPGDRQ